PSCAHDVRVFFDATATTVLYPLSLHDALPILKVTGLPVSDPDVAVRVLLPAVALSVQLPTVATPLAFVVWLPPVTVPFPEATPKVTATPPTAFPFASLTITDGGEATAVPAPAV